MAKAGRKAKSVTVEELTAKIERYYDKEDYEWIPVTDIMDGNAKLLGDIRKIDFDLENYFTDPKDYEVSDGNLVGFHTVDGLTFLGVIAGGDWEFPVFFIIYMDPKGTLRGYVPEDGNTFNPETRAAFGNYDEEDDRVAKGLGFEDASVLMDVDSSYDFDWTKIRESILGRIAVA